MVKVAPEAADDRNKIGIAGGVSYVIGVIIGSGIFITPTSILANTGSVGLSMGVWVLGGVMSIIGALCYIELGTSMRESGGDFAYVSYVRWHPVAFAFVYTSFVFAAPCGAAIYITALGEYLLRTLSPIVCLDEFYGAIVGKLFGVSILWVLMWLNLFSLRKHAGRVQTVLTFSKLAAMAIVIATGLYYLIIKGKTEAFSNVMDGTETSPGKIVLALYGSLWAYNGWDVLNFGLEDVRNPKRSLPIASIGGTVGVMAVYLLANTAYFTVLGKEELLSSDAVAQTLSIKALGWFQYVVPFLICIVIAGSLNGSIFAITRFFFAASRRGKMLGAVGVVHAESESPRPAVIAFGLMGIAASFAGNLEQLIGYVGFIIWMQRTFTMLAILWIRIKKIPVHKDAIRVPLILHIIFLLISVALVIIPIYRRPKLLLVGGGIWASGIVVYFLLVRPKNMPGPLRSFHWINDETTKLCQKIFLATPDDKFEKSDKTAKTAQIEPMQPKF